MTDEWTVVTKKKKSPNRRKKEFDDLAMKYPHIMMPEQIQKIGREKRIDGLVEKVLSSDWIEFQKQGWKYVDVIKPEDRGKIPNDSAYQTLPLENKWGDVVLFKKIS